MLTWLIQQFLGLGVYLFLVLPYVRRVEGTPPRGRRIYVCNHVSLLDTLVVGGVLWRRRRTPILVLGDRRMWHKNLVRRLLSGHVGYLIERGRISKEQVEALRAYARMIDRFDLIVFPEGTRGDGVSVARCQPGIYYIAEEAGVPLVPVAIRNMHAVSSKSGKFHPISGLRKLTISIGSEFELGDTAREEFRAEVRERMARELADEGPRRAEGDKQ